MVNERDYLLHLFGGIQSQMWTKSHYQQMFLKSTEVIFSDIKCSILLPPILKNKKSRVVDSKYSPYGFGYFLRIRRAVNGQQAQQQTYLVGRHW